MAFKGFSTKYLKKSILTILSIEGEVKRLQETEIEEKEIVKVCFFLFKNAVDSICHFYDEKYIQQIPKFIEELFTTNKENQIKKAINFIESILQKTRYEKDFFHLKDLLVDKLAELKRRWFQEEGERVQKKDKAKDTMYKIVATEKPYHKTSIREHKRSLFDSMQKKEGCLGLQEIFKKNILLKDIDTYLVKYKLKIQEYLGESWFGSVFRCIQEYNPSMLILHLKNENHLESSKEEKEKLLSEVNLFKERGIRVLAFLLLKDEKEINWISYNHFDLSSFSDDRQNIIGIVTNVSSKAM